MQKEVDDDARLNGSANKLHLEQFNSVVVMAKFCYSLC